MSAGKGRSRLRQACTVGALTLLAMLATTPTASWAQYLSGAKDDRAKTLRLLEQRRENLSTARQREQALEADMRAIGLEQAKITAELIQTGRLAQKSERELSKIEARLGELDAQEKLLRGSLARRHGQLAKLFAAMQRMGRNPPPVIVTERTDALKMVRSAMMMARAFPGLKSRADALARQLKDLTRVMREVRAQRQRLEGENKKLLQVKMRLATLVENKKQSLSQRSRELADLRRSTTEIARSVTGLTELLQRLDTAVAERTGLGRYNRELQNKQAQEKRAAAKAGDQQGSVTALPADPARSPPGSSAAPAKRPDPKVAMIDPRPQGPSISLEPRGTAVYNPGRMKPAVPFHRAKGLLPLPAQGRKLLAFGDKNQFGRTSKGIVFETRPGATVTSPCDGWIVYSGPFRSYGQILIINAGGGYHVLLANLSRIDVEIGRFVLAAEPVGAMSSNVVGRAQGNAPVLYVEFRNKAGRSIDPAAWWAPGPQKVQL